MANRTLIPLLALLALAAFGYWLWASDSDAGIVAAPPGAAPPPARDNAGFEVDRPVPAAAPTAPAAATRTAADSDGSHADAAQGIKGRVLLPDGTPAGGVAVYLLEALLNDPIRVFLASVNGVITPARAAGTTAADGTFALGIPTADGKAYDLRVAADRHPELSHQSIVVHADQWYDTGDLSLDRGVTLHGRVVDGETGAGLVGAAVFLVASRQAQGMMPTPGRERGIAVTTDGNGAFRFDNAAPQGHADLTAEAPGYAGVTVRNQPVGRENPNGIRLELLPGRPLAGIVVDDRGQGVARVRVTARGLSQKTPQTESAITGRDGRFTFASLQAGPYEVTTQSDSHTPAKTPPVLAGEVDLKLVLAPRPWARLRVLTASGADVKDYRISLKRHFPQHQGQIGNVFEFADRNITPRDYPSQLGGDWAAVRGLPTGAFVFQIMERNHAKTVSEPFTVRDTTEPNEVTVRLTLGAMITGTVVDDGGKPLAGAVVSTDRNNALPDGVPIFGGLGAMLPKRHTQAQTRTDAQGRFRLDKLAFAEYMVHVNHDRFCRGASHDIVLEREGQIADIGVVRLERGAVLTGFTTIGNLAAGQIKVQLGVPPPDRGKAHQRVQQPTGRPMFSSMAISDNDGRYRMLRHIPPGEYRIHAVRTSGTSNPFDALLDIRETERRITVSPGQDRLQIDFNLSKR